jgi:formate dehydrogenase subunit gamma
MGVASKNKRRHALAILWSIVIILVGSTVLPLSGYVYVGLISDTRAQSAQSEENPRADFWGAVRKGNEGYVASQGPYTTNVLVQNGGQNWRQIRNGPVASYGAGVLIGVIVILLLFYAIRGSMRLEKERSGKTVFRWSSFERLMHWFVAILFIILAITGLSMLFGRAVLIPWLGLEGFSAWASVSIALHNWLGPLFVIGMVAMILVWIVNNLPKSYDWEWFKQGGGVLKGKHPPAGKANAGEKLFVFWIGLIICGITVSATGVFLDFPIWGQSREDMQLAQILHASFSMIWIAIILGHAYLGTIGTEGAFEGMVSGRVSVEWAEQHHDKWYEEVKNTAENTGTGDSKVATGETRTAT